jgi:hypothetical protein
MKALKNYKKIIAGITVAAVVFTACNKDLDRFTEPAPQPPFPSSTTNIAASLAASPNDSLFNRLLIRSGLQSLYADSSRKLTVFATDNNGMRAFLSGFAASIGLGSSYPLGTTTDAAYSGLISNIMPQSAANSFISNVTVGQVYKLADFPVGAPNFPLPSLLQLSPTALPPLRSTLCIDKSSGAGFSYVNDMPIVAVDQAASNGVIHKTFSLVAPQQILLKQAIAAEPTLSYFRAAILRADSGQVNTARFDSLMNFGVMNMTVLAPNDIAMRQAYKDLAFADRFKRTYDSCIAPNGQPAGHVSLAPAAALAFATTNTPPRVAQANAAIDASPTLAASLFPVASVRGIVAYHIIGRDTGTKAAPAIRLFTNNLVASPSFLTFNTLINSSLVSHPGVRFVANYASPASPFPNAVSVIGVGPLQNLNGTTNNAFTGTPANVIFPSPTVSPTGNRNFVNGSFFIIDKVLSPQ